MSLFKIDGYVLSMNEVTSWIGGFIKLYRNNHLRRVKLPGEIVAIMKEKKSDQDALHDLLVYLKEHDDYMPEFIDIVKEATTTLAMEKGKK